MELLIIDLEVCGVFDVFIDVIEIECEILLKLCNLLFVAFNTYTFTTSTSDFLLVGIINVFVEFGIVVNFIGVLGMMVKWNVVVIVRVM